MTGRSDQKRWRRFWIVVVLGCSYPKWLLRPVGRRRHLLCQKGQPLLCVVVSLLGRAMGPGSEAVKANRFHLGPVVGLAHLYLQILLWVVPMRILPELVVFARRVYNLGLCMG